MTLNAIDDTIRFLEKRNLELRTPDNIYYITYLVGLFAYNQGKNTSDETEKKIVDWYNTVNFSVKGDNSVLRKMFTDLIALID
jgi:hypothetical protein